GEGGAVVGVAVADGAVVEHGRARLGGGARRSCGQGNGRDTRRGDTRTCCEKAASIHNWTPDQKLPPRFAPWERQHLGDDSQRRDPKGRIVKTRFKFSPNC